jgi:hypothetical protein
MYHELVTKQLFDDIVELCTTDDLYTHTQKLTRKITAEIQNAILLTLFQSSRKRIIISLVQVMIRGSIQ